MDSVESAFSSSARIFTGHQRIYPFSFGSYMDAGVFHSVIICQDNIKYRLVEGVVIPIIQIVFGSRQGSIVLDGELCSSISFRSKEVANASFGTERMPAVPIAIAKFAPTFMPQPSA